MGKQSSSAPTPPDPATTAKAQTDSNVNTAISNAYLGNTNQITPWGSLTFNKIGSQTVDGREVPQFEATTTLSPEQQRLYASQLGFSQKTTDLANAYAGRIGDATAQPFSYDGMPAAPQYDEAARVAARDRIVARQEPQFAQQDEALRTRLLNSGVAPGSEAYGNAYGDFNRSRNDYYLGADAQAGTEAARLFGLQGDARTRAIQEALAARNQPINEATALLGAGSGVQTPQFVNTQQPQIGPTDIAGIYNADYQNRLLQYQIDKGSSNSMMGGLFGLGGSALGGWGLGGFKLPGLGGGSGSASP